MRNRTTGTKNLLKSALFCMASSVAINGALSGATVAMAQIGAFQSGAAQINLPSGPLADTLVELGDILNVTIVAPNRIVAGRTTPAISGVFTPQEAFQLALSGSGLSAETTTDGAILISEDVAIIPDQQQRFTETIQDTVVVTGSRIERTAVNAPSPIDILTADEIAAFGLTDTTEVLRFIPALNTTQTISTNGDFPGGGDVGSTGLNLRGLGTNRTLVLVDGRRHVAGFSNSAVVDVSSIPTALIERVEVLTGGGSSIYGADAVTGVVNYILKDDFEGVEVRTNTSLPTQGDGESFFGSVIMGGNYSEGRGNAVLSVEYTKQTELISGDRRASREGSFYIPNTPELSAALEVNPAFRNILVPDATYNFLYFGPRISPTGSSIFDAEFPTTTGGVPSVGGFPVNQILDSETGQFRAFRPVPFISGVVNTQGGDDFLPQLLRAPATTLVPESDRWAVNALTNYEFTPAINGFIEAKYARNVSSGTQANVGGVFDIPVLSDNPFVPQQLQDQLTSLEAQGIPTNLQVSRNFYDQGTVAPNENTRETFRIVGGFEGAFGPGFSYELSANYGRTQTSLVNEREFLPDRFAAAADVILDPSTGQPICRSDVDPDAAPPSGFFDTIQPSPFPFASFNPGDGQCAPLNLFAPFNQLNPEAVDVIFQRGEVQFTVEQFVLNGILSGDSSSYFALPAGGVQYVLGFEYREEDAENRPDTLQLQGLKSGGGRNVVSGGFDVFEGFAEVSVPLLADLPFAKNLSLDASVRIADYSSVGQTTSFAVGGIWQPFDDLRIRSSFNRAVRAPNINELFTPVTEQISNLPFIGSDPCEPANIDQGAPTRAANCAAVISDLANFDPSASYLPGGLIQVRGGNPDLQEETADTFTVGFAYTPSFLPGLSFVADYYNIEIADAVSGARDRLSIVENCVDSKTADNPFCDAVTRNPSTGAVEIVQNTFLNFAVRNAEGVDYQVTYGFDVDNLVGINLGDFTVQLAGNYQFDLSGQESAGFPLTQFRLDGGINFPKHFVNFSTGWRRGSWSADYGFNFTSSTKLAGFSTPFSLEDLDEDPLLLDRPETGSAFVHYLGGAYELNDMWQFSLRVNNLLDRDPFEARGFGNSVRPVSFLGRTVQLGVRANF